MSLSNSIELAAPAPARTEDHQVSFQFSSSSSSSLFGLLHCSREQWRVLYYLFMFTGLGSAGPAQPKKKISNKKFGKFMISPCIFYEILLNIGLYFYTVKIQIQY